MEQEYIPGKVGRPTKYDPNKIETYRDRLIEVAEQGGLQSAMCIALGINSRQTLNSWRKDHPEFEEIYQEARLHSLAHWEQIGHFGTLGKLPKFNATSWAMIMNNAHPESYKRVSGGASTEINIGQINSLETMSTRDLALKTKQLESKLRDMGLLEQKSEEDESDSSTD